MNLFLNLSKFYIIYCFVNHIAFASQEMEKNNSMSNRDIEKLMVSLDQVLNYIQKYYYEINIDGALGVVMAEAQLLEALENSKRTEIRFRLTELIQKCQIYRKIVKLLPKRSIRNFIFIKFSLNPMLWKFGNIFMDSQLVDLGIFKNWTEKDLLRQRIPEYNGVSSDECLLGILKQNYVGYHIKHCPISSRCRMLMLENRNDTGYLITHRLLYLQVVKLSKCEVNEIYMKTQIKKYCSSILKETKTNEFLGYPYHDIFLEQVVLCGMEGFTEFLQPKWMNKIIEWQSPEGCYHGNFVNSTKMIRSANVIAGGCTDHATGLGAAALSLNLKFLLSM